jgi:hypothetical protein
VVECFQFLGSYTWGPVQSADIQIAGEKASAVPIQVLSDTDFTAPTACASSGPSADTVQSLGANAILGVGVFAQDCGTFCTATGSPVLYYECSSATNCVPTPEALAQQVPNPVAFFSSDNNGVIIELPALSGGAPTLSGSLVFGIGTQSNNGLGGATVYTTDGNGFFTSNYKGTNYPGSFIDSGSNGYFFLETSLTGLPNCTNATGFYCPPNTVSLTGTNSGSSGASGTVNFGVANAETLFSNLSNTAFADLGGAAPDYFDWGLPFFFGRNVYTAIENTNTPGGAGPYWAY